MAKLKKNRVDSDALLKKKSLQGVKRPNPFEIQTSRSKFTILNRDTKANRFTGIPGVQKARAIEKRKQTLGHEFLQKNKSNRFTDQRKDGRNMSRNQMASEHKSMASRRKEMFNLNDTVKLTHRGQTLEEIERFDDAVDNDDDSDEDGGQLDAKFMEAAHFGGGEEGDEDHGKDRKTVIEEMIAESKRRKAEKQRENDEVYEMTQKLDQNWQSLMSVVGDHMKGESQRPQLEDYDKVMREMIFERRGKPADKLKSEEDLARLEKQKLEKLERDRLARMKGEDAEAKVTHRSADDLDDGYLLQTVDGNEDPINHDVDVDAEDGLYDPREISKEADKDENVDDANSNSSNETENSDSENDNDNLSDLKEDSDSDEELANQNADASHDLIKIDSADPAKQEACERAEATLPPIKLDLVDRAKQEDCERAAATLPFTFELPRKYEQLQQLLQQRSPDEQLIIMERMIKSNNAKYSRENKPRLISLFAFLLQHLNDIFAGLRGEQENSQCFQNAFQILYDSAPYLYDLAVINTTETSTCFQEVLKEKVEEYHKRPRRYPQLDTLIFLKLVPVLYSASDFQHPVVSPTMVFISEMLSRCQVRSRTDITSGLFLSTISLECTERAKRCMPAVLNFLNGVFYLCFYKRPIHVVPVVPPFKSTAPLNNLLAFNETTKSFSNNDFRLLHEDFILEQVDEPYKLRALAAALKMTTQACHQIDDLPAIHHLTMNILRSLERLDEELLPATLMVYFNETINTVKMLHIRPLQHLVALEQKPKPLRLLEPKIEVVYDDIRRRPKNPQQADKEKRKKLQQKVKRESRAAAREIRQDNEFIAKLQFKQRAAGDRERKERVKRIFSDATTQQGELNSLDRKAKYKK